MKLSVLIPVYNERYLVEDLVGRVMEVQLPDGMERELVIVDDGSTDGTRAILEKLAGIHPDTIRYIPHEQNRGKGGAIRTAIAAATGDFCLFQDADLEYDPEDYPRLLAPLLEGRADVVYGSRYLTLASHRVLHFWHSMGNRFLTFVSNLFTNLDLSDMETCYKVFRTEVLRSIPLRSESFAMEPEITAKVAKRGLRLYEVPIRYAGRSYSEGKKITWRDGCLALWTILKYAVVDDLYVERPGHQVLSRLARARRFNAWMADTLRPWVGDRVLEVGAGIGNVTRNLQPRERYVATDADALHLRVLEDLVEKHTRLEAVRLEATRSEDYDPFTEAVDTLVCVNVLAHIEDHRAALARFHEVLDPGGRLLLLVPRGTKLYSKLDRELDHQRRYDEELLSSLLEESGFLVEEIFDFNRVGVLGWILNGKLLRRDHLPKVQLRLYELLVPLWRRIDRFLPWGGLSLVAVARKAES